MVKSKDFEIQFSALKLGSHQFSFDIEDAFFTLFENSEIEKALIRIELTLVKKATLLIGFRYYWTRESTVRQMC